MEASNSRVLALNILREPGILASGLRVPELKSCPKCRKELLTNPPQSLTILSCDHVFHRACIEKDFLNSTSGVSRCPIPSCHRDVETIESTQQSTDTVEDLDGNETTSDIAEFNKPSTNEEQEQESQPEIQTGTQEKTTATDRNSTTDRGISSLKRNSVSELATSINAEETRPSKVSRNNSTSVATDKKEKESHVLKGIIEELTTNSSEVSKDLPIDGNDDDFLYLYNKIVNAETHSEIANQEVIRCYYSLGKVLSQRFKYHFEKSYNEHTAQVEVNKEFGDRLPSNITKTTIRKKTERARKIHMLFCDNREGLIRRVQSYSAISISKLSVEDIAQVIAQIKSIA